MARESGAKASASNPCPPAGLQPLNPGVAAPYCRTLHYKAMAGEDEWMQAARVHLPGIRRGSASRACRWRDLPASAHRVVSAVVVGRAVFRPVGGSAAPLQPLTDCSKHRQGNQRSSMKVNREKWFAGNENAGSGCDGPPPTADCAAHRLLPRPVQLAGICTVNAAGAA